MPDANRVYLGQWKMKGEMPATRYDIATVRGAATRTADGYMMEFLLPAAQIRNYHPQAGSRLGLNLNLTIQGKQIHPRGLLAQYREVGRGRPSGALGHAAAG